MLKFVLDVVVTNTPDKNNRSEDENGEELQQYSQGYHNEKTSITGE